VRFGAWSPDRLRALSRLRQTVLVSAPETVYAKTSAGRIGYQAVGEGPPDVLVTKPAFPPVDLMWDEPRFVRFLNGLSSFSRHIWFDMRGTGSSDAIEPVEGRMIESAVDDMIVVLDELGCERVVVLGAVGQPALQFAATHPERTSVGAHQPDRSLPASRRLSRRVGR
jgi:pimeloyl-ACP methyl ester carboxylesterase